MPAHMFLFIPDVVIKELDGLKANNDDLILESCLQCVSDIASTAVLLSNDKNLCIKAAINGIPTISEFRGNHHALLDEIQAQTPFHIASNVSHLPFQSAQDPHPIANSSTLHHEQYDSDVYMMDMDEMPSNTGHDIPAPVFLEALPTPVNISPASMHQEQQDLHALLQLESGLFGCVLACIPVILQKAHGNDWIAIARVSQPTELAHIIEMIDQLWHSVFVDVLGKNIHAQLSLNRRIAQDIRRSVRRQKMALTRGDLLIFLRDMESIACECCRYCGFMDDAVRVRGIIQHVRSVLVEVNYS
ncbi:hypothetical protein BSLG_008808 [Batrachochytrium salamandrivorans]|nr:hypothetical protein BSLG_008808 [Batrachochytrium salamandrivorans]